MRNEYEPVSTEEKACKQLRELKQNYSVERYISRFNELSVDVPTMNASEKWSLFMAGSQQEHQRMLATQVADGDFATAVMMLKKASAYTDRPNVPKKDKRHGGGGGKGQVNVAAGEGSSAKKSQDEVNALFG